MSKLKLFENKQIRSAWNEDEQQWYFSVVDVVGALTDSVDPKQYIKRIKSRDELLASKWGTICTLVGMVAADGKKRRIMSANTKGILRIIQSIPSPKAEPFKQWLAQVGAERLEEIENPELAEIRMRETYLQKGYSEEWIKNRERGMVTRNALTDEWRDRGIQKGKDYAILTAEISRATFGVTPAQHKNIKGLKHPSQNLRDHMTDLELILTMLGEATTTELIRARNAQGMDENQKAAHDGGVIAGNTRKDIEKQTGKSVISPQNYIDVPEAEIRKQLTTADTKD